MGRDGTFGGLQVRSALALFSVLSAFVGLGLAASPALASDGTGTMTVSPTYVVSGSTGNYLDFLYTAGAGGISNGQITIFVPSPWPAPSPSGFDANGLSVPCEGDGNLPQVTSVSGSPSGNLITISGVTLSAAGTCDIKYGIQNFNSGVNAPTTAGAYSFTTQEKSTSGGTLTNISSQPVVNVGDDGTGTMTVSPTHVTSGTTGNTLTFTYTATRTMTSGHLTIAVPTGWSTPSTTGSAAGATTSGCGTVSTSGSTITVASVTLSSGSSCTVVYGDKASGPGATTPTSGGGYTPSTFTAQQEATNDNNLIALASSPQVSITATDGSGTMVVSPTKTIQNSTGNEFDFTYTAPAGGLSNGQITLFVPQEWPRPSSSGFDSNGISDGCEGDGNPPTVTNVSGGYLITSDGVNLNSTSPTCVIKYGINGFNAGVTAPGTQGLYAFTTQVKTWSGGTLTNISSSPTIQVGNSGTGTLVVAPTHAYAGSGGNTLTFTYTAANDITAGALTIAVPTGWSTPSASSAAPGATTSTCGTPGANGTTIQVTNMNLSAGQTCTVTYGDKTGGPGATAPSTGGSTAQTFTAQEQSDSSGTLTTLSNGSPTVTVTALDGAGTMAVSPSTVITSSTGNEFDFTYTAPAGGVSNGQLTLFVPQAWPQPSASGFDANGISDGCEGDGNPPTVTAVNGGGYLITTNGVFLNSGTTCVIKYGINGFNSGVTAPSTNGPYTFTTQIKTWSGGTLTSVGTSPVITVGNDGTGTMTVSPSSAVAGSAGNTLTFTYTAAATVSGGVLTVAVPNSWSPPSTISTDPGATTSTCGTVSVSGATIQVTGLNRTAGQTCTITYGSTAGGPGATADPNGGPPGDTFPTEEKSSSSGTLVPLGNGSPTVTLHGSDGIGTMTVSPNSAFNSSTGNDFTFTYTAPAGGVVSGSLAIKVPTGWTTPSATTSAAGGTNTGCNSSGGVTVSSVSGGSLITVSGVSLTGGNTCQIRYGLQFSNAGVTAPAGSGAYTFTAQEASSSGGTLTSLGLSPAINVSTDGSGTMAVSPLAVSAGATGQSLTFTYTSGVSMTNGEVTVAIPAGWSPPSTTGTDPGFTTTDCPGGASVSVFGNTIHVSGITIAAATPCSIIYGATSSGGPGAVGPTSVGSEQFQTQERSSNTGSLTDLAATPQNTVYAPDGSGTMTAAPSFVADGSGGNTLTFTYRAPAGGLSNGQLLVALPDGWSPPSTTPQVSGYTTSTCGNVANSSGAIQVANISLAGSGTCTITYGNRGSGGAGATAPSTTGTQTFTTQEASTGAGTLAGIPSSPQIDITAPDGSGTMAVLPGKVATGSSGNTLTFTYTAATGGVQAGELTLDVPAGWSTPSSTGTDPGSTTSNCGQVDLSGSTVQVTGVTMHGGDTCTIVYGSTAGGGLGATAPSSDGSSDFVVNEGSTALAVLTPLASSPSVATATPQTLSATVNGTGTVTGNGISCPGTCSRDYFPGTNVSLTAQPGSGFEFSGWAGACSGTGTCDLTITNTAADVTATFIPIPHTLTATVNGSGTVTGNGISCPGTCSKIYDEGTSVSLAAAPAAGFAFTGWTGACSGTGTCDLTMANDKDVTATFTAIPHTLTVTVKGKGHVSGNGISCPGTCSKIYDEGTAMSLSAQPAAGFKFAGWSGACTGQAACQFMITKDSAVTATFKLVPVCVVPKVKGDALSRAETLIRAAHCAVGNVTRPPHSKGKKLIVGSTKPGAGTRHPAGTKVNIALVIKRN